MFCVRVRADRPTELLNKITSMADAESEVAALKKELQTVKQRAVGKIKTLTSQVDQLTKDLAAANSLQAPSPGKVSPPESSEEGSESSGASGFVKVKVSERELEERESVLAAREETLAARERAFPPKGLDSRDPVHRLLHTPHPAVRRGEQLALRDLHPRGERHLSGHRDQHASEPHGGRRANLVRENNEEDCNLDRHEDLAKARG